MRQSFDVRPTGRKRADMSELASESISTVPPRMRPTSASEEVS